LIGRRVFRAKKQVLRLFALCLAASASRMAALPPESSHWADRGGMAAFDKADIPVEAAPDGMSRSKLTTGPDVG
jgi:hypothetical protein